MMKKLRYFCTLLLMAVASVAWAQSDYSTTETSNVDLAAGTNGSACTVNGPVGIKVGTSKAGGDMTVTVPAGTKYLHVHAAAWNNVSGLSLNISGATASPTSIALTSDSGVSGNSPFNLSGNASDYYFVIELSNITAETTLTFTTSIAKRFVIWGVNAEEDGGGSTALATTTAIDASGITNTDVYVSTEAGSLSATVTETESGDEVSGATVTWTSSKESVATVDENGLVTLVAAGTTTITAAYAGVSGEFVGSSATYELTVTSTAPYEQPTEFEIGLNNALFNTEYTGSVSGITDDNPVVGTQDNVTVTYAGAGNHYVNDSQIRFYPNNKLTFEAPDGYEIKEIVFTADGQWNATISADGGTYDSDTKTWSGSATSVLFTGGGSSGHCRMSKAAITLGAPSTVKITIKDGFTATTFSCDKALDFSGKNIQAFIITDENGTTEPVTVSPANEGLYIEGEPGSYEIPIYTGPEVDPLAGNLLVATEQTTGQVLTFTPDASKVYYVFGKQNGKEAFFKVPAAGYTLPDGNKAVLEVDASAGAKEMIVIGGEATGIDSIDNGQLTTDNYYTVDGKLVKGQPTQKGLYIVNGRKVVVK